MTWSGQNLDVIAGCVALIAAPFSGKYKFVAWAANIIEIFLIINVVRVAVLSSPLPFSWKLETPLLLGLFLPYAYIVPISVGSAITGHVLLTRRLLKKTSSIL